MTTPTLEQLFSSPSLVRKTNLTMPTTGANLFRFRRRIMVGEFLIVALAWATLVSVAHAQQSVRINFGRSTDYTDLRQRVWKADPYTNTTTFGKADGIKCAGDPIGTFFDPVYCTYRSFSPGTTNNMPYLMNLPVPQPGQYQVRLHFSETVSWGQPGIPVSFG